MEERKKEKMREKVLFPSYGVYLPGFSELLGLTHVTEDTYMLLLEN